MKLKIKNKTTVVISLFFLTILLYTSCTKDYCSRESREMTEFEKDFFAYNTNDTVFFTNTIDTFLIICEEREYSQKSRFDTHPNCERYEIKTWSLTSSLRTNIPFLDSRFVEFEFTLNPYSEDEGIFRMRTNQDSSIYLRHSDYYILPNKAELVPAYTRNHVEFYENISLNNINYKNVNKLIDTLMYFDTMYYNNEVGFIRFSNKTDCYDLLN